MYPHERSLVQKFKDKPFVMMGVNADEPNDLKGIITAKHLNWDSWADGMSGPIATAWNVSSWPTAILIDAKGVIRYRDPPNLEIEPDIEKLINESGQ